MNIGPVDEISLYIHIPFCTSRCRYCSFYFETGWSPRVLLRCLDAIIEHGRAIKPQLFPSGLARVHTVYLGGGTPSVVPPEALDDFLYRLRTDWDLFDFTGEFAFECNPESLSQPLLEVLAKHKINRLSMGVQSLDEAGLRILGRRAGRADVERAVQLLSHARWSGLWRGSVNFDLIAGIPGQTLEGIQGDVEYFASHGADHVSLYTLTVEPGTSLEQLYALGQGQPPDSDTHEALWAQADQALEAAGFHNYEVSNYARPGMESKHNSAYWELRPYLGLGPGAVGTVPSTQPGLVLRHTNHKLFAYAGDTALAWHKRWDVEELDAQAFFIDHLLTGLRRQEGLELGRLVRIFGPKALDICSAIEQQWIKSGVQVLHLPGRLALTRESRLLLDPVLRDTLAWLETYAPDWGAHLDCNWPPAV